jgi:hypothetical protein
LGCSLALVQEYLLIDDLLEKSRAGPGRPRSGTPAQKPRGPGSARQ